MIYSLPFDRLKIFREEGAEPVEPALPGRPALAYPSLGAPECLRLDLQVRTRPTFSEVTSPLASSTCRCWTTAESDILSGSASSLTEAGPRQSRSTITRRPGSARAWNIRSSEVVEY